MGRGHRHQDQPQILAGRGEDVVIIGGERHRGHGPSVEAGHSHHGVIEAELWALGRGQGELGVEVSHDDTPGLGGENHITRVILTDLRIHNPDLATSQRLERPRKVRGCHKIALEESIFKQEHKKKK